MKQLTLSLFLMFLPIIASADAVEVGGIYYNLIKKGMIAEVTRNPDKYKGNIIIPAKVTHEGEEYSVKKIADDAFNSCSGLTSVTIPNSVISLGSGAFQDCSDLISLTIPNSVTTIGSYAFFNCTNMTSVSIPNSVTSIGVCAFYGCSGLTSVTIPNSVSSIGSFAFQNCSDLSYVAIGNSVTRIGNLAFHNCSSLTTITIPNNVTDIEGSAFEGCSSLTSITIGNGVNSIRENAFTKCTDLTDVYCMAENVPSTNTTAFDESYIEYATLHVPASAINAYKTTAPWSGFGEIVAISGEAIVTPKCATPTISFENGKIKFNCETEGAEFVSEITTVDTKKFYDSEITPTYKYKVSVYATKAGYDNSDTATAEFTATGKQGDMNGDNNITVTDALMIVDQILKNK